MDEENRPREAVHGRKVLKVEGLSKTYGKTRAILVAGILIPATIFRWE